MYKQYKYPTTNKKVVVYTQLSTILANPEKTKSCDLYNSNECRRCPV